MNVPKLRFKEFNDEWIEERINGLVEINPKNPSLPENFIYIDLESVSNGILLQEKIINKNEAPSRAQRQVKINDILYQTVRPYQKNNLFVDKLSNLPYIASTGYAIMREKKVYPKFLFNKLHTDNFVNEVLDNCTGTSYPAINSNDLGNIKVYYPSNVKEQERIGDFLSLLDKKIELQTKKIEDLKLFKLCINNNLFNGNKTIKLKDICECKSSTISLSDIEYDNGIYPIYGANGEIKKINSYQHDKEYLAIIKDGAGVGKTIICNKKSSIIATLNALIPNDIPVYYFNELINKIDFSKYIVGSGIPHIYFKDYSNEKLYLHDEKERLLINNLFKKISIKIELEENKLHLLEALKKGLMQNMFV